MRYAICENAQCAKIASATHISAEVSPAWASAEMIQAMNMMTMFMMPMTNLFEYVDDYADNGD